MVCQKFQTSVVSWNIYTTVKLIAAGATTISVAGSGACVGTVFDCLIIGYAHLSNSSFFSYAILVCALLEAVEHPLMVIVLILITF